MKWRPRLAVSGSSCRSGSQQTDELPDQQQWMLRRSRNWELRRGLLVRHSYLLIGKPDNENGGLVAIRPAGFKHPNDRLIVMSLSSGVKLTRLA